jgi:hypothetical protein
MFAITVLVVVATAIVNVPRVYVDYSRWPALSRIVQPAQYGTDTIADMYESKVVLHDVRDMYTKTEVPQTPLEASTWSKEASAPYPPLVLLAEAALYRLGDLTGIGFYGLVAALALVFIGSSAVYFWRTRWYAFPLLYLNFGYFGARFFAVQDGSYLVVLVTISVGLWLSERRPAVTDMVMAIATVMKISPLGYAANLPSMPKARRAGYVLVLAAGLLLPIILLPNYAYIFRYQDGVKGHWYDGAAALVFVVPFTLLQRYVECRRGYTRADRVGWDVIPVAMWLAFKMNVARHLLIMLLVPDRRAVRNVIAAVALLVPLLVPGARFNAALPVAAGLLVLVLVAELGHIGWRRVRMDLAAPGRTARELWHEHLA